MRTVMILPILLCACSDSATAPDFGLVHTADLMVTDAACREGEAVCDGEDSIRVCSFGRWDTSECERLCAKEGSYSIGCKRSGDKDACVCVQYAKFWELCGARLCGSGLVCRMVTLAQGICTQKCCERPHDPCNWLPCPAGYWCGFAGLCAR
jgi:hypothetical protein